MRGPAGTERGGVSMAGGREGQSAREGNGVKRLRQIGAEMVQDSFKNVFICHNDLKRHINVEKFLSN